MKSILIALALCALMVAPALAFDPSLVTKDGFAVKTEAEIGQYGMKSEMPHSTLQLYGAGATYGVKSIGTKVSLSAGGAIFNVKDGFDTRDYSAAAPYLSLGVSQQVYDLMGVKLGLFADGTYIMRLNDTFEGFKVGVAGMTLVRTGAIAQYQVMEGLDLYGGINGQWLNANVHVENEKVAISNNSKLAGFGGAKYDIGPVTLDANVGFSDHPHYSANISYNF